MHTYNQIVELSNSDLNKVSGGSPSALGLAVAGYLGAAFAWGFSAGKDFAIYLNKKK